MDGMGLGWDSLSSHRFVDEICTSIHLGWMINSTKTSRRMADEHMKIARILRSLSIELSETGECFFNVCMFWRFLGSKSESPQKYVCKLVSLQQILNKQGIKSRMFTFLHLWNLNDPFRIWGYSKHKDRAKTRTGIEGLLKLSTPIGWDNVSTVKNCSTTYFYTHHKNVEISALNQWLLFGKPPSLPM